MKLLVILAIGLPGLVRGQLYHYLPQLGHVIPGAESGSGLLSSPALVNEAGSGMVFLAAEQPFGMAEWKAGLAALALPVSGWNLGCLVIHHGIGGYAETCPVFAIGRPMGDFSLAILGGYDQWKMGGYGSAGSPVYGAGIAWNPSRQIRTAIGIRNPIPIPAGSRSGEMLAGRISLQFRYEPSEKWGMLVLIGKEGDRAGEISVAWWYQPVEALRLSMSWQSGSASYGWAGAWTWKHFTSGLSVRLHPSLGITPGMFMLIPLKKEGHEN